MPWTPSGGSAGSTGSSRKWCSSRTSCFVVLTLAHGTSLIVAGFFISTAPGPALLRNCAQELLRRQLRYSAGGEQECTDPVELRVGFVHGLRPVADLLDPAQPAVLRDRAR